MAGRYAESTEVPVERSRAEVERTLERYGASEFGYARSSGKVELGFVIRDTRVGMVVPMPERSERRFTHHSTGPRTPDSAEKLWEQACRSRWRALALVVKAKLEAVASGISSVEREFLADVFVGEGLRVYDVMQPQLEQARKQLEARS